jgi:Sigma-70 region 2
VTSRSRAADDNSGGGGFADRRRKAGACDGDREGDNALATRAAAGDREALETLLERHVDRIHAVCRRVLGDREDALDATQEAMIAVARGIGRYDGRSAFTTWLYRVATNAALDEGTAQGAPTAPDRHAAGRGLGRLTRGRGRCPPRRRRRPA